MSRKNNMITRRQFVGGATAAALALAAGRARAMAGPVSRKGRKNRVIRFAHLSDIHVEPKKGAPEGLTTALRHVQALEDKPEMIITGGDNIMDCLGADDNWTNIQFKLLKDIFAKECRLPVKHCIGNHDVWGWDKKNSKTTGNEKLWGKKRAVYELDLPNRYYSFDKGPWRIIILDSTYPDNSVYTARLDDEQFEWLEKELETHSNSHVCIISHIPILSAAAFLDGDNEKSGRWTLPDEWMHLDARKIKNLFLEHPNVRLCISGHMHMVDKVLYNDVTYICDGAVSGAWWKGNHYEFEEGYGLFDLYDDGTFDYEYIAYGWEPKENCSES
jgi:Icc protein